LNTLQNSENGGAMIFKSQIFIHNFSGISDWCSKSIFHESKKFILT